MKAQTRELTVATASDLAPLQDQLGQSFQQLTGIRLRFVTGASGVLARQARAGAPYDLLLLANTAYIKDLATTGHVAPETVRVYAVGRLGVWSKGGLGWADLAKARHIAIPNPAHAPYGVAAREALKQAGLWERLQNRLVLGENVRQTLQYAETGNAEVAITAWSLVKDKGGSPVESRLYAPVEQAGGVVALSSRKAAARRLLDYLTSEPGQKLLESGGFVRPAGSRR